MPQCPTCGSQCAVSDTICAECGTELSQASLPQVTPPSSSSPAAKEVGTSTPLPATDSTKPTPPGRPAKLTLRRAGKLTTETWEFDGPVVIGRFDVESGPVDIDLGRLPEAEYLSRRHAQFDLRDGQNWSVSDLGSQNGTFHRSSGGAQFVRVTQEQALTDGDEVSFGNARFEFRLI